MSEQRSTSHHAHLVFGPPMAFEDDVLIPICQPDWKAIEEALKPEFEHWRLAHLPHV
jgi:hypothetical protein